MASTISPGGRLGTLKSRDAQVEMIRVLRVARRGAMKARIQAGAQLDALIVTAPEPVRVPLRKLTSKQRIRDCAVRRQRGVELRDPAAGNPRPSEEPFTVTGMDAGGFWLLLERSARETAGPRQRLRWLEHRLSRVPPAHIVDFQVHLDTARRPVDTYAMWGADSLIMDGICSDDGFWYFQCWLIGQGQHWYRLASRNPDNLAGIPAVRALAGRRRSQWADAEWPEWEELDYVAVRAHGHLTGQEDSLYDALDARGHVSRSSLDPTDSDWDFGNLTEIQRRLPRLAGLFPPPRYSRT